MFFRAGTVFKGEFHSAEAECNCWPFRFRSELRRQSEGYNLTFYIYEYYSEYFVRNVQKRVSFHDFLVTLINVRNVMKKLY